MGVAYYNENDPFAAGWLRNLINAGLIAPGDVDERSIKEVKADDLKGYKQCHFFAGIGGWSLALRRAGWPDERPVWTGSCPCQPFSVAGFQKGFDDERHLWPTWRKLISERSPPTVFGEQVAAASKWLDLVRSDLEKMGYAVGAIPIEAASADADHFRDRYWFVADRDEQRESEGVQRGGQQRRPSGDQENNSCALANGHDAERRSSQSAGHVANGSEAGRNESDSDTKERRDFPLVNPESVGWGEGWTEHEFRSRGFTAAVASIDGRQYVECPDGKWRRLPPPRVRWLGIGLSARVAKLRAIGNAIDPRPAAAFIKVAMEYAP